MDCNKWATLLGGTDGGGGCACVGVGGLQEISVPSSHFNCDPKTALEKQSR